jgi:hypothetical protein
VGPNSSTKSASVGFYAVLPVVIKSVPTSAHVKSLNTPSNFHSTATSPAIWTTNHGREKQISDTHKGLPLGFEADDGTADSNITFLSRSPGHKILLTVAGAAEGTSAPAPSIRHHQLSCPVSHPIKQITFARPNRAKLITESDGFPWRIPISPAAIRNIGELTYASTPDPNTKAFATE